MASLKQIAANRANALESTGPRTSAGKAISAQNARSHGLLSKEVVVETESREEFKRFRLGLLESLRPSGALEVLLVDRIVACAWRLRRAARIETEAFAPLVSYSWEDARTDHEDDAEALPSGVEGEESEALVTRSPSRIPDDLQVGYTEKHGDTETVVEHYDEENGTVHIKRTNRSPGRAFDYRRKRFEHLSRYERSIENSFFRALHELQRLQAARQGSSVALSAALDVTVLGTEPG